MTFREATDLLSVPMDRVAEVIGRSYATVAAYRSGDRDTPPDVLVRLAGFMRRHAASLEAAADRLERVARRAADR
jgi:hypothetical protein